MSVALKVGGCGEHADNASDSHSIARATELRSMKIRTKKVTLSLVI